MAEEEEDQRALHVKIFGDDDSDAEDEEYVAPVEEMSGKKRLQKTKPSSSKKRRSAPDAWPTSGPSWAEHGALVQSGSGEGGTAPPLGSIGTRVDVRPRELRILCL